MSDATLWKLLIGPAPRRAAAAAAEAAEETGLTVVTSGSCPELVGELGGVKSNSDGSISESESSSSPSGLALPRSLSPECLEPGDEGERPRADDAPPCECNLKHTRTNNTLLKRIIQCHSNRVKQRLFIIK